MRYFRILIFALALSTVLAAYSDSLFQIGGEFRVLRLKKIDDSVQRPVGVRQRGLGCSQVSRSAAAIIASTPSFADTRSVTDDGEDAPSSVSSPSPHANPRGRRERPRYR